MSQSVSPSNLESLQHPSASTEKSCVFGLCYSIQVEKDFVEVKEEQMPVI